VGTPRGYLNHLSSSGGTAGGPGGARWRPADVGRRRWRNLGSWWSRGRVLWAEVVEGGPVERWKRRRSGPVPGREQRWWRNLGSWRRRKTCGPLMVSEGSQEESGMARWCGEEEVVPVLVQGSLELVQMSPETRTTVELGAGPRSGDGGRRWSSQGIRLSLAEVGDPSRW
jgi:hypothetical protein